MADHDDQTRSEIALPFRFKKRPVPIATDFRRDWKVSVLLLILQISSRGGKSSLRRLHVLNWAVRTTQHQRDFVSARSREAPLFAFKVRFEPAFSRAIEFAEAQKLVEWVDGDRVLITDTGRSYVRVLIKDGTLLRPEISFLETVGKSLKEPEATRLLTGARIA